MSRLRKIVGAAGLAGALLVSGCGPSQQEVTSAAVQTAKSQRDLRAQLDLRDLNSLLKEQGIRYYDVPRQGYSGADYEVDLVSASSEEALFSVEERAALLYNLGFNAVPVAQITVQSSAGGGYDFQLTFPDSQPLRLNSFSGSQVPVWYHVRNTEELLDLFREGLDELYEREHRFIRVTNALRGETDCSERS